jgi:hypothetical protein
VNMQVSFGDHHFLKMLLLARYCWSVVNEKVFVCVWVLKDDKFFILYDWWNINWIVHNYLQCCRCTPLALADSYSKTTTWTFIFLM